MNMCKNDVPHFSKNIHITTYFAAVRLQVNEGKVIIC